MCNVWGKSRQGGDVVLYAGNLLCIKGNKTQGTQEQGTEKHEQKHRNVQLLTKHKGKHKRYIYKGEQKEQ